ncbi:unnamed protein product [Musa acuminata var. zebrina]
MCATEGSRSMLMNPGTIILNPLLTMCFYSLAKGDYNYVFQEHSNTMIHLQKKFQRFLNFAAR